MAEGPFTLVFKWNMFICLPWLPPDPGIRAVEALAGELDRLSLFMAGFEGSPPWTDHRFICFDEPSLLGEFGDEVNKQFSSVFFTLSSSPAPLLGFSDKVPKVDLSEPIRGDLVNC